MQWCCGLLSDNNIRWEWEDGCQADVDVHVCQSSQRVTVHQTALQVRWCSNKGLWISAWLLCCESSLQLILSHCWSESELILTRIAAHSEWADAAYFWPLLLWSLLLVPCMLITRHMVCHKKFIVGRYSPVDKLLGVSVFVFCISFTRPSATSAHALSNSLVYKVRKWSNKSVKRHAHDTCTLEQIHCMKLSPIIPAIIEAAYICCWYSNVYDLTST